MASLWFHIQWGCHLWSDLYFFPLSPAKSQSLPRLLQKPWLSTEMLCNWSLLRHLACTIRLGPYWRVLWRMLPDNIKGLYVALEWPWSFGLCFSLINTYNINYFMCFLLEKELGQVQVHLHFLVPDKTTSPKDDPAIEPHASWGPRDCHLAVFEAQRCPDHFADGRPMVASRRFRP